jgi:trans-aconitate methyltransferase
MTSESTNFKDATFYDSRIGYVAELGKGVIDLLAPRPGERILDIGCGTGSLTSDIAKTGASVLGIDLSEAMIEKSREKYPQLSFAVANAETFRADETFDAVFSNAALHWMKRPEKVIESAWLALDEGGRFVVEFGGKGNIDTIYQALLDVLSDYGINAKDRNPWYFPSIGEYSTLLENQGFRVMSAVHFDRPTQLDDGENGFQNWIYMFCNSFFKGLTEEQKMAAINYIEQRTRPQLFQNGKWIADYKRIRILARKETKT